MATIPTLVSDGRLVKIDPLLEPNEQEHRLIYALPSLLPRLENELPEWKSIWGVEQTPIQQLDALLEVYGSGEVLTFDRRFKPLNHLGEGIWELKTPDLRIFGWFCVKDVFIAAEMDLTNKIKTHNLYRGYAGSAVRRRNQLELDEPKFIPGEEPADVVSSYAFP